MRRDESVLLVGTGQMGIEYAKVLKQMGVKFIAVGRSQRSANKFEDETGTKAFFGGINKWLKENKRQPQKAIVSVSGEELGNVTIELLKSGFKLILVEKPGGKDAKDIKKVAEEARIKNARVFIAYNRRFYASVLEAKKIITKDGGVRSFSFEFTEWSHIVSKLKTPQVILEKWFLHNSTHVLDLAFFLGGKPEKVSSYCKKGSLPWHSSGSIYTGAGISKNGALFSYQANWEAPGRWGVEVLTNKHRFIFRPLEKLQVQNIGSIETEEVAIDNKLDIQFKPGLYKQAESFLGDKRNLCSIHEQADNLDFYNKIAKEY